MSESETFEKWCVVEIMGHKKLAGLVTEATLAGVPMLRVDVPETKKRPGFSQFYSGQSIYCVTPVEEKVARAMAESFNERPIEEYRIRHLLTPGKDDEEDEPDFEDGPDLEYEPDLDESGWADEF